MEATNLRDIVRNYVDTADEHLLQVVKSVVEDYKAEIVAYTPQGEPLTRRQYTEDLKRAEEEIAKGEGTDQEDLERESKEW